MLEVNLVSHLQIYFAQLSQDRVAVDMSDLLCIHNYVISCTFRHCRAWEAPFCRQDHHKKPAPLAMYFSAMHL